MVVCVSLCFTGGSGIVHKVTLVQCEGHLTLHRKFQRLISKEPPAICVTQGVAADTLQLRPHDALKMVMF